MLLFGGMLVYCGVSLTMNPGAPPSALPGISPSRGEIGWRRACRLILNVESGVSGRRESISPLEGEMSGRTEGGASYEWIGRYASPSIPRPAIPPALNQC
jgi:hypothetical protein